MSVLCLPLARAGIKDDLGTSSVLDRDVGSQGKKEDRIYAPRQDGWNTQDKGKDESDVFEEIMECYRQQMVNINSVHIWLDIMLRGFSSSDPPKTLIIAQI